MKAENSNGTTTRHSVDSSISRQMSDMDVSGIKASVKRLIKVDEPEKENGNIEYKRHLLDCLPGRLEKLKTQMSFRLDEGNGRCLYRIGVEDDGCHSLMDYETCAETAKTLEYLARTLNSVVVERKMIQNEVVRVDDSSSSSPVDAKKKDGGAVCRVSDETAAVVVNEESLLGDGSEDQHHRLQGYHHPVVNNMNGNRTSSEEKTNKKKTSEKQTQQPALVKTPGGAYTRCELCVVRVETHLLDQSPILRSPLFGGSPSSSEKENNDTGAQTNKEGEKDNKHQQPPSPSSVEETLSSRNIRVAVVGNVDAGKSTLIGTLISSLLDDGRGSSRTSIMKHRHEIESGRTSTASTHLMGFRSSGQAIAGKDSVRANRKKSEDEIARESYRVVSLMDLAGHEKYLKTTIHGVASGMADYALILVNSRHPPTHMTHHHLNLCVSFGIHIIIIFTKIDGCPEHAFKNSRAEVGKLLRLPDVGKRPFEVRNEADIQTCLGKFNTLAPIITTSCVTGEGIELLQKMLYALPKRRKHERKLERSFEFLVEDIFNVPGVGSVVSGFVNAGQLTVGSAAHVYVGPCDDGTFLKTVAKSAQIARINTSHVTSGQSACLALALSKDCRKKLRRGMVVLQESPMSVKEFEAEICVLKGEGTTIRKTYQAYVHILNVRQSCYMRQIEIVNHNAIRFPSTHTALYGEENEIVLRPGSRAKVRFEFARRPEYVRPGMRMLFRDGRVRGIGLVTGIPTVQPAH